MVSDELKAVDVMEMGSVPLCTTLGRPMCMRKLCCSSPRAALGDELRGQNASAVTRRARRAARARDGRQDAPLGDVRRPRAGRPDGEKGWTANDLGRRHGCASAMGGSASLEPPKFT